MTRPGLVLIGGLVVIAGASLFLMANKNKPENTATANPTATPTTAQQQEAGVPLPQETDIIRTFINLIDEGRPEDAVGMMGPKVVGDDANKQAWAVMFNAFESMKVVKLEPSMPTDWTADLHTYGATLDVKMKPAAASVMPMPNYGWDNGENRRWISLEKIDNHWTVQGFATGP